MPTLREFFARRSASGLFHLESYFELAAQPLIAVSRDGKIRLLNHRTAEMFGYEAFELMGQSIDVLLPERYRAGHSAHLIRYFSEPRERAMGKGLDLAGCRKDRTEFPVEIGLRWIDTREGVLAIAMVVNITERKRIEAELARVNTELTRSNAELAQFAYVASHDLQEPLRMVTGYLQLLERRYKDKLDADAGEFIHFAVDGAMRMKNLIQDLLRLSRAGTQTLEMRTIDSRTLVAVSCANLQVLIEETGAQVTSDSLPEIMGDPGLLTQVFQNLIGNALKFRAAGVRPRVHVSGRRQADTWIFAVRDNGIGIDPQYSERIFRIFERLHGTDEYGGSGVGLAISQRIVERHGGRIWMESKMGEGSTFLFSLPIRAVRDAPPAASAKGA